MAHTPGPWHAETDDPLYHFRVTAADGNVAIVCHGRGAETDAANARLLAEAPVLLEMLRFCLRYTRLPAELDTNEFARKWNEAHRVISRIEGGE